MKTTRKISVEMQKRAAPSRDFAPVHKKCRQHSNMMQLESTAGAEEAKSDSFDSHDEQSKIAVSISNYQWTHGAPTRNKISSPTCTLKIKPQQISCSPDSPTVLNARWCS